MFLVLSRLIGNLPNGTIFQYKTTSCLISPRAASIDPHIIQLMEGPTNTLHMSILRRLLLCSNTENFEPRKPRSILAYE